MAEDKIKFTKLLQFQQNWYYPGHSEADARDLLLRDGQYGDFLVCPGQEPGQFRLCVRRASEVSIVKIHEEGGFYVVDDHGGQFSSVLDILYCFTIEEFQLTETSGNIIELKKPFILKNCSSGYLPWYHGRLPQQRAEQLLKQKERIGYFLIRDHIIFINQLVLCVLVNPNQVKNYIINVDNGHFSLGAQAQFKSRTLEEFVKHYRETPFTDDENISIQLGNPLLRNVLRPTGVTLNSHVPVPVKPVVQRSSPPTQPAEIRVEIESVGPRSPPPTTAAQIRAEFDWLQDYEKANDNPAKYSYANLDANKKRNRFKNIFPFDHTRVVLRDADPHKPGDDYINASYIKSGTRTAYIACQGCLANTIESFWRMIWQEDSRIIVMLTELVENGRNKCVRYWPQKKDEKLVYTVRGYRLTISLDSEKFVKNDYVERRIGLIREDENPNMSGQYQEVERRDVFLYQYLAWPDKSVPEEPEGLLLFLQRTHNRQIVLRSTGPIVVHCSAGIGRTGTFVVLGLIIIDILKKDSNANVGVKDVLLQVRNQRPGMVQTSLQYELIYHIVNYYKRTQNHIYGNSPNVSNSPPPNTVLNNDPVYENTHGPLYANTERLDSRQAN